MPRKITLQWFRPRKTKPVFAKGLTTARATSEEAWDMPQIPVQERERLNDTLDPKVKEHFTWLSKHWSSYLKETEESSSTASTWSRPSSWWDQSLIDTSGKNGKSNLGKNKIGGNEHEVMVSTWLLETGSAHVPWATVPAVLSQSFLRVEFFLQLRI